MIVDPLTTYKGFVNYKDERDSTALEERALTLAAGARFSRRLPALVMQMVLGYSDNHSLVIAF
jgi:hypothetical protein